MGPLSVGALGRLIHERLAVTHPRPLLVRLHEASSGNPFHALEISRSLKARALDLGPGEPFPIPPQVGPLVRDHLASLSREARRAVVIVAMTPDARFEVRGADPGRRGRPGDRRSDRAAGPGRRRVAAARRAIPLYLSTAHADAPPAERRALRRALAQIATDPVERAVHLAAVADRPTWPPRRRSWPGPRPPWRAGRPALAADLYEHAARLRPDPEARGPGACSRPPMRPLRRATPGGRRRYCGAPWRRPPGRLRARAMLALGDLVYVQRPTEALPLLTGALEYTDGDPPLLER